MGWRRASFVLVAAGGSLLAPALAHADAIDGHGCAADGRVMTIAGASILTPGGTRMTGDYSRHAFSYVAPAGERDAGATIAMVLLNEETVRLNPGNGAADEIWHRCDVIS
jgi:hypothetical protein